MAARRWRREHLGDAAAVQRRGVAATAHGENPWKTHGKTQENHRKMVVFMGVYGIYTLNPWKTIGKVLGNGGFMGFFGMYTLW